MAESIAIHPLTPDRWDDFMRLFGPNGACQGCWCMFWRVPRKEFDAKKGDGNRRAMKELVEGGREPGLIAYSGGEPAAWCSVAPRSEYRHFETSRILAAVDDEEVWSVVCFFVDRKHRREGLARDLLRSAVDYALSHGAKIVEGYPVDPARERVADTSVYTGLESTFRAAGFVEVARRSETRPIMRYHAGSRRGRTKSRATRSRT